MAKEYLTFDDVQLVPKYSEVQSRKDCKTFTQFTKNYYLQTPLVAAPMDTVCGYEMASVLMKLHAVGCVHRFMTIDEQVHIVNKLYEDRQYVKDEIRGALASPLCMAIGATGDYLERAQELIKHGANVLVIDVAHGHHIHVKNAIGELKKLSGKFDVIAGNVATAQAAQDLEMWGADAIRVGIGGGSVCETRLRTGVGIPQLSCVSEIIAHGVSIPVISDGGIRYTGDVAKAIAVGASSVMLGSLFAGTEEAPGDIFIQGEWPNEKKFKMYRGSASKSIKLEKNGHAVNVEGASKMVEYKGNVINIVNDILDGLRSAMSYLGASSLKEMQQNAQLIKVTRAGITEAKPHLLEA